MPRMLPPEIGVEFHSNAEGKVFNLCQQQLGPEWTVFHSVGIASHKSKPWAEIDFVLVGPPGVYCLEVKGGRVYRHDGMWHFVNSKDEVTVKPEGPFEQVAGASCALFNYLKSKDLALSRVPLGYGVVTPDFPFMVSGPDIIKTLVYDESDLCKPFTAYVRRLSEYWLGWLKDRNKTSIPVDALLNRKISDLIRKDFDLRPSLKARISRVKDQLLQLTEEQYSVLDGIADNDRAVIRGAAGTGKTLLAIEEARRRANIGERVLLCCFNENLGSHLAQTVADQPNVTAGHFHGIMAKVIDRAGLRSSLPSADTDSLMTVFFPEACIEGLMKLDELQYFDSLIIDEGQDLFLDTYIEVFDALVKNGLPNGKWLFFYDPSQNIYSGISPSGLNTLETTRPAKFALSLNCRNSAPIATMTSLLSGIEVPKCKHVEGPEVEISFFESDTDQVRQLSNSINRLLGNGIELDKITVLGPRKLENSGLRTGLKKVPYELASAKGKCSRGRPILSYWTISEFKGLESDVVLLCDIRQLKDFSAGLMLYVGGTRACAYLEILISKDAADQFQQRSFEFGELISVRS